MSSLTLTAKTWGVRPSELIGLKDEYDAYCFDEVSAVFWMQLKNQTMQEASKGTPNSGNKKSTNLKGQNMMNFMTDPRFKK